jgi:transketolase
MAIDKNIFFLTADMGINLVEKFESSYPNRYLNVGIAEQNLIGVASGLAKIGFTPYVYTISNFLVHRCLEQIRNDVVLHDLPVKLIGPSTGYDNGPLGPTHHMLEDWGVINCLQNIDIYTPFNKQTSKQILIEISNSKKPAYVRIPKGEGVEVKNTHLSDTLIVSYGSALPLAIEISEQKKCEIFPVLQMNKYAIELEFSKLSNYEEIIVIEDHFSNCGLYSILSQILLENKWSGKLRSVAPKNYSLKVGNKFEDFLESEDFVSDKQFKKEIR